MIYFPNAKINIGLYVTAKRSDGYHNLETIFYPVGLSDILEVSVRKDVGGGECFFKNSGIPVDCLPEENLVIKAYHLLAADYELPAVNVHLHKIIPFGAGLGGGSSDATFMLKALNECCGLNISDKKLQEYAARLGSDCAFFVANKPMFACEKGDQLEEINLSLSAYRMMIVKPDRGVATSEAYRGIVPEKAACDLRTIAGLPVEDWKGRIMNDFEKTVIPGHPEIGEIKQKLYNVGAAYASMTGSGSAVFALFDKEKEIVVDFPGYFVWLED